ncbi:MAG: EAL domain-containing protein [Woeseiaceae bacterium]
MDGLGTRQDLGPLLADHAKKDRSSRNRFIPQVLLTEVPCFSELFASLKKVTGQALNFSSRRSLASELLLLQVLVSFSIGAVAVGALWLSSQQSIEDNMRNWGEQWLIGLDELAMPLYVASDEDRYLETEKYVTRFPEIAFVRFYDDTGNLMFEDMRSDLAKGLPAVTEPELMDLVDATDRSRYLFVQTGDDGSLMRVGKPIWTESFVSDGVSDGMLGLDLNDESMVQETLVGFIELGLNTSKYREEISAVLEAGMRWGALLVLLITGASLFIYRRALRPLSQLQVPLKQLAEGQTDFEVKSSGHQEIAAIAEALNTTVSALNEREDRLFYLANHDLLTGLSNRHSFMDRLGRELEQLYRRDIISALLFIDLDHFKYVNDTAGHAAGDRLLKEFAQKLSASVRKQDTVGRFGGDEFVVLLSDVNKDATKSICEKIIETMGDHKFVDNGETYTVHCSIGATLIRNVEHSTADLLSQADLACHKAKSTGRNRYELYESSTDTLIQMSKEIGLSRNIIDAIENDNFVLQFQPIVSAKDGETCYYEALLRMRVMSSKGRPKMVLPEAFLPAAERFDLMIKVDQWAIRHAIEQLAQVRRMESGARFTINVSGSMFESRNFVRFLEGVLKEFEVPMSAIVIEISEQVVVKDLDLSRKVISTLVDQGCEFALDDFGAGYSFYSYLKSLPIQFVKIDGSFIREVSNDVVDKKIVESIVEIAHATGVKTIAEHVETKKIFDALSDTGVDYLQGYYIGRAKLKAS